MKKEDLRLLLPWSAPENITDDDGANCTVTVGEHVFSVSDTGDIGINSGRKRWRVFCTVCGVEVHSGSTSATAQIRRHLDERGCT